MYPGDFLLPEGVSVLTCFTLLHIDVCADACCTFSCWEIAPSEDMWKSIILFDQITVLTLKAGALAATNIYLIYF